MAKNNNQKSKEIILKESKEMVLADPEAQLDFAKRAASALTKVVEEAKAYVDIKGNKYLKFEGWQTLARFFGLSVGIENVEKLANGYQAKAVVYNREGQIVGSALAVCTREEKNWRDKPEFQLLSMAQTRAASKALRNILSWIAVLSGFKEVAAEEAEGIENNFSEEKQEKPKSLEEYLKDLPIPELEKKRAILSEYGGNPLEWPEELVEKLEKEIFPVYIVYRNKAGNVEYYKFQRRTPEQEKYLDWLKENTNLKVPDVRRLSKDVAANYLYRAFAYCKKKGIKVPFEIKEKGEEKEEDLPICEECGHTTEVLNEYKGKMICDACLEKYIQS